jgi:carbamoyl-phosphate synthase large subunit
MSEIRVLVTAVGSELAFSVIKAIKHIHEPILLVGTDIYPEVVGKYWVDSFYQVPPVADRDAFLDALTDIVQKEKITHIIPTADAEITYFAAQNHQLSQKLNCHILTCDGDLVHIYSDKWLSFLEFKQRNIPCAQSLLWTDNIQPDEVGLAFPLVIKPRVGGGSRHIHVVNDIETLIHVGRVVPAPIVQEYLGDNSAEYSAGIFISRNDHLVQIVLHRTLKFGMTNTAEVIRDEAIERQVASIACNSGLRGSFNIQFRMHHGKAHVLEINPRFSGTTGIRAHFGFNDVEMWIRDTNSPDFIPHISIKSGRVLRFMEEQYHYEEHG